MKFIKLVAMLILVPVKLLGIMVGVVYRIFMLGFDASKDLFSWFEKSK